MILISRDRLCSSEARQTENAASRIVGLEAELNNDCCIAGAGAVAMAVASSK